MSSNETAATLRAEAVDIDLRCALAFGRSALQALSGLSDEAKQAVDRYLAMEADAVRLEQPAGAEAIGAMIADVRMLLRGSAEATEGLPVEPGPRER